MTTDLVANLYAVQAQIAAACARAGRDPHDVTLVAVSKMQPIEVIAQVQAAGVAHFGENRIEEAQPKIAALQPRPTWHMIGHVQSRKAKAVAQLCDWVHSVDSVKLAQKLAQAAHEARRTLPILLEVNVSGEQSKSGFVGAGWSRSPAVREELWRAFGEIGALEGVQVQGLMTMAPFYDTAEEARWVFRELAQLGAALAQAFGVPLPHLSMGMTNDYGVAIEEGATFVRVGRAIFGER